MRRQARKGEGHGRGVGARDCGHGQALFQRRPHQAVAWIGDERRAGIADQRHRGAGTQAGEDTRGRRVLVVLVKRRGLRGDRRNG